MGAKPFPCQPVKSPINSEVGAVNAVLHGGLEGPLPECGRRASQ